MLDLPHMPTMLENGQILIFDNGKFRGHTRVLEIDPPGGEIVWEFWDPEVVGDKRKRIDKMLRLPSGRIEPLLRRLGGRG